MKKYLTRRNFLYALGYGSGILLYGCGSGGSSNSSYGVKEPQNTQSESPTQQPQNPTTQQPQNPTTQQPQNPSQQENLISKVTGTITNLRGETLDGAVVRLFDGNGQEVDGQRTNRGAYNLGAKQGVYILECSHEGDYVTQQRKIEVKGDTDLGKIRLMNGDVMLYLNESGRHNDFAAIPDGTIRFGRGDIPAEPPTVYILPRGIKRPIGRIENIIYGDDITSEELQAAQNATRKVFGIIEPFFSRPPLIITVSELPFSYGTPGTFVVAKREDFAGISAGQGGQDFFKITKDNKISNIIASAHAEYTNLISEPITGKILGFRDRKQLEEVIEHELFLGLGLIGERTSFPSVVREGSGIHEIDELALIALYSRPAGSQNPDKNMNIILEK